MCQGWCHARKHLEHVLVVDGAVGCTPGGQVGLRWPCAEVAQHDVRQVKERSNVACKAKTLEGFGMHSARAGVAATDQALGQTLPR